MGKFNKLKENRKNIETKETVIVPKVQNTLDSLVDYNKYNLNEKDTEELKEKEFVLIKSSEEIKKNFATQARTLYEAQQIFTNNNSEQNFNDWFNTIGFKKTYVYQAINIYKLYLDYNIQRIFELPKETVYQIAQKQNELDKEEIIEILENDKPNEKLKEINRVKEESKKVKYEIDLSSFIQLDIKEQKKEIKNIKLSRKNKIEELARKKDDLKELKEEIEKLKEEIRNIKQIEEQMKLEILK